MATETKKGKRAKSTSPEALLKDIRRNWKCVFSSEQKVQRHSWGAWCGRAVPQVCY